MTNSPKVQGSEDSLIEHTDNQLTVSDVEDCKNSSQSVTNGESTEQIIDLVSYSLRSLRKLGCNEYEYVNRNIGC